MARPNLLLVLLDQWRYEALGANGGAICRTPMLDAFAAEGVRCTRAYTPIGICSPARASLLTALYPHGHGVLNNVHEEDALQPELPPDLWTFPEALAAGGYRLGHVGKWHVGRRGPESRGFQLVAVGDATAAEEYGRYRATHGLGPAPAAADLPDAVFADLGRVRMPVAATDPTPFKRTYSAFVVDEALRLLDDLRGSDAPFFLQVSLEGPHHPYVVPEPFASMYDPAAIPPWASFADNFRDKPAIHAIQLRHRGVAGWTWDDWAPVVAKYFGFVSHIDDLVGRLLGALRDRGLENETLVVVAADHGDFAGGHRQFNKGPLMYEDVYHTPLLARWPGGGIEGGSVCERFVRLLDLGPTLLEAAGAEPPDGLHGRSVLPLWRGEAVEGWPETVFAEYHGDEWGLYSQRMVGDGRWKLVYNGQDRDELYDLETDPAELRNLADDPAVRGERLRLERLLAGWMEETGDPIFRWARLLLGDDRQTRASS